MYRYMSAQLIRSVLEKHGLDAAEVVTVKGVIGLLYTAYSLQFRFPVMEGNRKAIEKAIRDCFVEKARVTFRYNSSALGSNFYLELWGDKKGHKPANGQKAPLKNERDLDSSMEGFGYE